MPFDWQSYLDLAGALTKGSDEARFRSAVSRAYYFAYHEAKPIAERSPAYQPPTQGAFRSHQVVWDALAADADQKLREAGEEGRELCRLRHRADYVASQRVSASDAFAAIERAKLIAKDLRP